MNPNVSNHLITGPSGIPVYYSGPPLSQGALPCLFYFALSGEESLHLDPFNQPVVYLAKEPIRVFSMTIPGHEKELSHLGLKYWAQRFKLGHNIIEEFIDHAYQAMCFLIDQQLINENFIAAAGLSRGAFIASHLAARDERIKTLLCFAPLTTLNILEEDNETKLSLFMNNLSVMNLVEKLGNKTIRCYIGNRDTLVGTERCFAWFQALVESSYQKGHRSPPIELITFPSIGHKGHGTPSHIFLDGITWLTRNFKCK